MTENICIAVDAACDLPLDYIKKHHITIIPIAVRFGNNLFKDTRDLEKTVLFYQNYLKKGHIQAETVPFSVKDLSEVFQKKLIFNYSNIQVITIMAARSKVYHNIREALLSHLPKFKKQRKEKGIKSSFKFRVMDSQTMFTGQGVLTYEAIRLLEEGIEQDELIILLENLRKHLYAYLVPNDLYYMRKRARAKGDNSISWANYHLGSALDIKPIIQCYRSETQAIAKKRGYYSALNYLFEMTKEKIDQGLLVSVVVMSYAGNLTEIEKNQEFIEFCSYAKMRGINVLLSMMSTTAAINVGPGAFSLAYASDN